MSTSLLVQCIRGPSVMGRVLARIARRRLDYLFYYYVAHRNVEKIASLADYIGKIFMNCTDKLDGIRYATFRKPGYEIQDDGSRGPICWEAPVTYMVVLDNKPAFGLGVEFAGGVLSIRQMQGIRGTDVPKKLRTWPHLFVEACIQFATAHNMREVRIYRAEMNLFYDHPDIEPKDGESYAVLRAGHQLRMLRRYNETATKLDFEPRRMYFVRHLR